MRKDIKVNCYCESVDYLFGGNSQHLFKFLLKRCKIEVVLIVVIVILERSVSNQSEHEIYLQLKIKRNGTLPSCGMDCEDKIHTHPKFSARPLRRVSYGSRVHFARAVTSCRA